MPESDDTFKDPWNDEFFKELMGQRRRMERSFMEDVKRLQEAVKSGRLRGRTHLTPIEKPGLKGYIFHGVFGTPGAFEGEGQTPELDSEVNENKENLTLPETAKQDLREPVVEAFTSGDEFVAVVELPGVEEHEVKVAPRGGSIQVDALNFKTIEVDIPLNADTNKMTTTLKNGVLEVRVPLRNDEAADSSMKFGVV